MMDQFKIGTKDSLLRSQHYYRAVTLNLTFGAEILRDLTQKCLNEKDRTLDEHLKSAEVEAAFEFDRNDLDRMQSTSNLESLDVTVLTALLLNTLQLDEKDENNVKRLRINRNKVAHVVCAELENDSLFNEASHLITDLARSAGSDVSEIDAKIRCLKRREVVQTCCNSDRITLCNEYYMMKLVECPGDGKASDVSPMTIRFGMTKFARQIQGGLKKVGKLLQKLREENIINDETKRAVELAYSQEDKIEKIILHLVTAGSDINILKASKCLRSMNPNGPLLATLVENSSDDGRNIKEQIDEFVKGKIVEILKQSLEKSWNGMVKSSTLHLLVEKKVGQTLDFCLIKDLVVQYFGLDNKNHNWMNSDSFTGLKWKVESSFVSECPDYSRGNEGNEEAVKYNFSDMNTEDFAEYLDEQMCVVSIECKGKFQLAISKENISASLFKEMTEDDMKDIFSDYIQPVTFGFGIKKSLEKIQKQIGDQYEKASLEEVSIVLRPFDQPVGDHTYSRGCTKPSKGNLVVPRHEYRYLPEGEHYTSAFMAKEVVFFVAAYMNGRQNGTIHFGISKKNEDLGEIIGISKNCTCFGNLDIEIQSAVRTCLKENAPMASLCIRPVQQVPVEGDCLVIEVDVVPIHYYLREELMPVYFPPKGFQQKQYAVYEGEIMSLDNEEVQGISSVYLKRLETRKHFERSFEQESAEGKKNENRLKHLLTQGNKYVTSIFTPVVISGNITGCDDENEIRQVLDIEYAVISCNMVFDFDTSSSLLKRVEKNASSFLIKTAENLINEESDEIYKKKLWIHCNGYEKSANEKERRAMDMRRWQAERSHGVKKAFMQLRDRCGSGECKVIFLVYQANSGKGRESIFEIARDSILYTFRGECIVIAETDAVLSELKKELEPFIEDFDDIFVTGISWTSVSNVFKTVFRANPDIACILPCSSGSTELMSKKEKQNFTDIEIVSCEECKHETEELFQDSRFDMAIEKQESFYRGQGISWWNFYFTGQVGKRSCFDFHADEIERMIKKGKNLVEEYTIYHQPGAGGTTLGWHLLWRFSQFSYKPFAIYRCCLLNTFGENTFTQLADFYRFRKEQDPNPFIVLVDCQTDEVMNSFKTRLNEFAYHQTPTGNIFCLILNIRRVPVHKNVREKVLKYELTADEKIWFNQKFRDMEKEHDSWYVDTLIGFNFMKNSFDPIFIQTTTDRLMEGIRHDGEHGEKGVLKCLALINAYGIENHPVPVRVFDDLMENKSRTFNTPRSYGITHALRERMTLKSHEVTWNVTMSKAMKNMLTEREYGDYGKAGLCIICQPLAKAVVEHLKKRDAIELEDIVYYLLNLVGEHKRIGDNVSKEFLKIVSRLFIEREKLWQKVRDRDTFSQLIMALGQQGSIRRESAEGQVVEILQYYFDLTDDPMIGQLLARYNISINDYDAAKIAIEESIEKAPNNSFLQDTYGQVFKSNMEFMCKKCVDKEKKISDDDAARIIELAFEAIEKFKVGQSKAIQEDRTNKRHRNMSSFYHEIKTFLELLEMFRFFQCYQSPQDIVMFLNDIDYNIDEFSMKSLSKKIQLTNLIQGSEVQSHIEESLRYVEEREYQVKKYDVQTDDGENIFSLRERFERFYGDLESTASPELNCPIGFAPMLDRINSNDKLKTNAVTERVKKAEENIEKEILAYVDDRDFIVHLGYNIILLSTKAVADRTHCSEERYCKFLSYSKALIENHTSSSGEHRGQRPILETFLYFALFHWPTESRTEKDFEDFCPPNMFKHYLELWRKAFSSNHHLTSKEQREKNLPKTFFCLGKGSPGNDVVHLKTIEERWKEMREKSGNFRKPTARDEFWTEELYQEELMRMNGIISGNGKELSYMVKYPQGTYTFPIRLVKISPELSNREVTFVVGFTWEGPVALYIMEKDASLVEILEDMGFARKDVIEATKKIGKKATIDDILDVLFKKPSGPHSISKNEATGYTIIKNAGESGSFVDALVRDKPGHIVICVIGGTLGEVKSAIQMIVIHSQKRTGVFHFPNVGDDEAFMKDGKLESLFLHREITKVFHDIGAVSSALINEYGILIDGTPVWDIEMVVNVFSTTNEATTLKRLGYREDVFKTWRSENKEYSRLLSGTEMRDEIVQSMLDRTKLISTMFEICDSKIDEQSRRKLKREVFAAANSGNTEKIKQLKEAKRGQATGRQKQDDIKSKSQHQKKGKPGGKGKGGKR